MNAQTANGDFACSLCGAHIHGARSQAPPRLTDAEIMPRTFTRSDGVRVRFVEGGWEFLEVTEIVIPHGRRTECCWRATRVMPVATLDDAEGFADLMRHPTEDAPA